MVAIAPTGDRAVICPAEWSRWNVSLSWSLRQRGRSETVVVAQPATRRMQARAPAFDDDLALAQSVEAR
jgi:hypothetical protein